MVQLPQALRHMLCYHMMQGCSIKDCGDCGVPGLFSPVHDVDAARVHGRQFVESQGLDIYVVRCALGAGVCDLNNHGHRAVASDAAASEGCCVKALYLKALPAHIPSI